MALRSRARKWPESRKAGNGPTPTQAIERSPPGRERLWFKKPRESLKRASPLWLEKEKDVGTNIVQKLLRSEKYKMAVHTHIFKKKEILDPLPSYSDISTAIDDSVAAGGQVRTEIIASRRGRAVAGYTLFRIKSLLKSDLEKILEYKALENRAVKKGIRFGRARAYNLHFRRAKRLLEEAGITLKFVPNKNAGYVFEKGRFVKKLQRRKP